jgi:hypothetical protein
MGRFFFLTMPAPPPLPSFHAVLRWSPPIARAPRSEGSARAHRLRRLHQQPATRLFPTLAIRPLCCFSPELISLGTRPRNASTCWAPLNRLGSSSAATKVVAVIEPGFVCPHRQTRPLPGPCTARERVMRLVRVTNLISAGRAKRPLILPWRKPAYWLAPVASPTSWIAYLLQASTTESEFR